jgi:hypothetical protein
VTFIDQDHPVKTDLGESFIRANPLERPQVRRWTVELTDTLKKEAVLGPGGPGQGTCVAFHLMGYVLQLAVW